MSLTWFCSIGVQKGAVHAYGTLNHLVVEEQGLPLANSQVPCKLVGWVYCGTPMMPGDLALGLTVCSSSV